MAILGIHKGSWGLPDFGLTEAAGSLLGRERTYQGGSNIFGSQPQPTSAQVLPASTGPVYGPEYLGPQNNTSSGGGFQQGTANPAPSPAPSGGGDSGGGQTGPSEMDMINQAYEQEQQMLGGLESSARSMASTAQGNLRNEAGVLKGQTQQELGLRQKELGQRTEQVGVDTQESRTRIKQMLNDLQQRNAAFLASRGGGAFESSLGQAVGERFGRTAASEVGGLENQRVSAINEISLEAERVNQFYDNKLQEIDLNLQQNLANIEGELQTQLGNIAQARTASARAKAEATTQAWQNYANQRAQLNLQSFNLQQSLAQWAMQKGQTLAQAQQFALNNTPTVNPAQFGIVPPTTPIGTGLGQSQSGFTAPQSGVAVNMRAGQQEDENDIMPYLQTFNA